MPTILILVGFHAGLFLSETLCCYGFMDKLLTIVIVLILLIPVNADSLAAEKFCFAFDRNDCEASSTFYSLEGTARASYALLGSDRDAYKKDGVYDHFEPLPKIVDDALGSPISKYDYSFVYEPKDNVSFFGQSPTVIETEAFRGEHLGCCISDGITLYFDATDIQINDGFGEFLKLYLCELDTINNRFDDSREIEEEFQMFYQDLSFVNFEDKPTKFLRVYCSSSVALMDY